MMLEFDLLSGHEIARLAKNQKDVEKLLPKLTTDEISSLVRKIDLMISCSYSEKIRTELMRLKSTITNEKYHRENVEIS